MRELIDAALELSETYPVFPCDAKKRPVCVGGFKSATQDAEQIERLFSLPNAALIGVPTGEVSGLDVIDIDVRDGKAGEDWRRNNAERLGHTRIARTQSGGWHYYYRHRAGIRNRAGIDLCVDVRGDGGYVIMPPSRGYSWVNDEDFDEYPEFMVDAVAYNNCYNDRAALTDAFGSIIDGREKYMADLVFATIVNYQRENGALPTPEWVIENAWPTYQMKVRSRVGDLDAEDRGIAMFQKKVNSTLKKLSNGNLASEYLETPKNAPQAIYEAPRGIQRRIVLRNLTELRNTPPPTFMVAPYIVDKSFAVLFGAPASFKSFLALDWALSIAHGSDWNGRPVEQGTVVYLALEGQTGLATRSEAWHRDMQLNDADVPFYAITSPISMVDEQNGDIELLVDAISDGLGGISPKLIVVDTLARSFVGKDENSATDMGIFVRNVDLLREHFDCTVLVVHHSGKSTEKGMRGSSALRGAVDSEFELVREAGTQSVCLKVRKQKDTEEAQEQWLETREISWLDGPFGVERSSLVLDATDQPSQRIQLTQDQRAAMTVLDRLIEAGTYWEDGPNGIAGIPENIWRQAVAEIMPEKGDFSNWNKFRKRLVAKSVVNVINGLVSKNGKSAT